jgi:hypothetical protein
MDRRPQTADAPERPTPAAETVATIDHELDLVESAIDFVLAGGAARVTVAGLRFGREIIAQPPDSRIVGRVRLEPIWRFDSSGCDIAVLADG